MNTKTDIIQKIESLLPTEEFIKPSDLLRVGLFRSSTAIRNAIDRGEFTFIKVSRNRLIHRESIIKWLRNKERFGGLDNN